MASFSRLQLAAALLGTHVFGLLPDGIGLVLS